MEYTTRLTFVAGLFWTLLSLFNTATAAEFSFQPRLEAGVMNYTFESGPISVSFATESDNLDTGFSFTQEAFEYSDNLLVLGGGGTLFINKFFFDFSGQLATGGDDSATATYSAYQSSQPPKSFIAGEPIYDASFGRTDIALSIGYAFNRRLSVFAGYKKTKTEFDTTYHGRHSGIFYFEGLPGPLPSAGGRIWGDARFDFVCQGPFVGAIHGWDFRHDYYLKGVLTGSLALAHLRGEVELIRRSMFMSVAWRGAEILENELVLPVDRGLVNRLNTKGETLGYTIGVGWRGATPVAGLSYSLNVSGYRYEFDASDDAQSDINETAVVIKGGLSYAF